MTRETPKPLSKRRIALGTATLALLFACMAWFSIQHPRLVEWILPSLFAGAAVVAWWAMSRLPFKQSALAVSVAFAIHFAVEHLSQALGFPPLQLLTELAVQVVCTAGFGAYWKRMGYAHPRDVEWPE